MSTVTTIIPCAGFGTRMGMKSNQSKELIEDPETGLPMIQWAIEIASNPLLIIRKEKLDLIKYAKSNKIPYIAIKETEEWPDTILKSKKKWTDINILLLPDTRFDNPRERLDRLEETLVYESRTLVFGVHEVDDVSKWGEVDFDGTEEKPAVSESGWAWGVIGFTKERGEALFKDYLDRKRHLFNLESVGFVKIENFKDLTRD